METDATTVIAPPDAEAARRFDQQLHTLVDEPTRAYILGLAAIAVDEGLELRILEGNSVRALLDQAIQAAFYRSPKEYAYTIGKGREELARRAAGRPPKA